MSLNYDKGTQKDCVFLHQTTSDEPGEFGPRRIKNSLVFFRSDNIEAS